MRTSVTKALSIGALLLLPACATVAQDPRSGRVQAVFSEEELDNLVAPVALYPDPLLAQILIAATFPDQVAVAARYVRERGSRGVDDQPWDVSVRAISHYPPVLNMLAEDEDWAGALGQAYAGQSADVMDAVQRLRAMAQEQGNLVSTREQTVTVEREKIVIVPANPQVIYVPTYDPGVVYFQPVMHLGYRSGYWSFGMGFPIGDWLVYDCDWYTRRVYYDGWVGGGWRVLARPYVVIRPVYVHPRYRVVHVGNVYGRVVNYINLDRSHRRVRRTVTWVRHDRDDRRGPIDRIRDGKGNVDDRPGRDGRGDNGGRDRPDRPGRDDRSPGRAATFDDLRIQRPDARGDVRKSTDRTSVGFADISKRREPAVQRGSSTEIRVTPPKTRSYEAPSRPPSVSAGPSRMVKPPKASSAPARIAPSGGKASKPSGGGNSMRGAVSKPPSTSKSKGNKGQ